MRQRGNSVIVFCECNIEKEKQSAPHLNVGFFFNILKLQAKKKKKKKNPYKIVAKEQNVTCRKYNVVLLCNAFGKSNPEKKKYGKEEKKEKG